MDYTCERDEEGTLLIPIDLNYMQVDLEERLDIVPVLEGVVYGFRKPPFKRRIKEAFNRELKELFIEYNHEHPDLTFIDEWIDYVGMTWGTDDLIDYYDYYSRRVTLLYGEDCT